MGFLGKLFSKAEEVAGDMGVEMDVLMGEKPCEMCACALKVLLYLCALPTILWTLIYVSNNV